MGNSPSATKLAKRAMSEGQIAVLFSASNGIERMDIYAPEAVRDKILKLADEINPNLDQNLAPTSTCDEKFKSRALH